jgi:hypothetical protein
MINDNINNLDIINQDMRNLNDKIGKGLKHKKA